jgi:hypothetical protein
MDKEPTRTIEDLQQENEQLISVIDAMTAGVSVCFCAWCSRIGEIARVSWCPSSTA